MPDTRPETHLCGTPLRGTPLSINPRISYEQYPDPPNLAFFVFPFFVVLRFLCLFVCVCVFIPFFPKDVEGFAEKDILAFSSSRTKDWRVRVIQKNPRVHKNFVRNSGAGNGCANFMDAWKNAFFLQEKNHVHKIPRSRGGVFWVWGGGGGSADFIFMGARILLSNGEFWGQEGYSQEFVFPRFWRSSGELFGVNSCQKPLFYV